MTRLLAALAVLALAPAVEAQERKTVAPKAMQAVAPALADFTDEVLFGDVWIDPAFSPRDRSLVTVTVLISTGKTPQLTGHLGRALTNGVKPTEIAGLATHLAFYSGWPNAVSALEVIEKVFIDRGVDMEALRAPAEGRASIAGLDAVQAHAPATLAAAAVAPKLAGLTHRVVFDDLWRRTDLSPRDRSLVTIAALAANGDEDQLAFYIRLALKSGLTKAEIGAALTHLAFYAGWSKATQAVVVANKVFESVDDEKAGARLKVTAAGAQPAKAPAKNFTGEVTVTSPFKGSGEARVGGATVSFKPGAHTNWHTHPLGQLLIITEGEGWVQTEGEAVKQVRSGDVVWTAPGARHWHGATRTKAMTHVAISEALNGQTVTWFEPVSDTQYVGPK